MAVRSEHDNAAPARRGVIRLEYEVVGLVRSEDTKRPQRVPVAFTVVTDRERFDGRDSESHRGLNRPVRGVAPRVETAWVDRYLALRQTHHACRRPFVDEHERRRAVIGALVRKAGFRYPFVQRARPKVGLRPPLVRLRVGADGERPATHVRRDVAEAPTAYPAGNQCDVLAIV